MFHRQIGRQTKRETDGQKNRQTDGLTDRQIDSPTGRLIDRRRDLNITDQLKQHPTKSGDGSQLDLVTECNPYSLKQLWVQTAEYKQNEKGHCKLSKNQINMNLPVHEMPFPAYSG